MAETAVCFFSTLAYVVLVKVGQSRYSRGSKHVYITRRVRRERDAATASEIEQNADNW